ncbi:hypothetical protein U8C32_27170 (plasmid) [Sinorhizobium medicae]|uniref:hypothetical protein n=1 Tax=Sinorhizobium medicae TaxID=110321 RepID=UPI002AF6BC64|nr:hypothetical protein [Sinorhizobium medicae]WQO48780.1 hypothetical protein U8C42_28935 [Sinorhizobium medicae]WQO69047.1 hypothetical protein U8C40_29480 [Sinorhizobium medicae]WQO75973.1 hypothetical protein U8C31_28235 [Sinorhizobium medicae]WQO95136.1 hypothetical protein U8C32_27170 [Sinorhizobium medicae]
MIDNLPNDTLTAVFRKVANQADRVGAFYEINALRSTNQRFRALIESDQTIRSEFLQVQQETRLDRFANARIEARNPAGTRTANDIITYHDVDNPDSQDAIKFHAAKRDIKANPDMVARTAIERNDVTDLRAQNRIMQHAASAEAFSNAIRGLAERFRQQGGRGR